MRRLEKDFALSGEERFGDQLNEREDEFETALAASTLATNVKTELLGLAHAYKLAFAGFLVSRQTLDDQLDDLARFSTAPGRRWSRSRTPPTSVPNSRSAGPTRSGRPSAG